MKDTHGGDIWRAARTLGVPVESILDFSASINPFGLSARARRSARSAISLAPAYPEPRPEGLIGAYAEYLGVDASQLVVGNGSAELLFALPCVLAPRRALIIEPAFSEYRASLKAAGVEVVSLVAAERDGYVPRRDAFERAVSAGVDLVYVANPANPTGAAMEPGTVLWLERLCRKHGAMLVVDEAFADFTPGLSVARHVGRTRNMVVLRSMTKFFAMAGLRLGFMVAPYGMAARTGRSLAPWRINSVAAAAATASLGDGRYIERTLRWLAVERPRFIEGLEAAGGGGLVVTYPAAANFVMARLTGPLTAGELASRLFQKGILIRELLGFRGLGPAYFRVAVRSAKENRVLIDAMSTELAK